jgi:hypothetical protein
MEKEPSPGCSFCAVNLTTDHILWHCKETVTHEHNKVNLEGQEMEKLIKYVRDIEFFDKIQKKNLKK